MVKALINQSRIDRNMDTNGEGHAVVFFDLYHRPNAALVRAKVAEGQYALDADPLKVPPEFVLLVGLKIAGLILSRPGTNGAETDGVFQLSQAQRDMMKQMEDQLTAVSKGAAVTTTDNPETSETTERGSIPPVRLVRAGINSDWCYTRMGST